jgi:hypothetical protein
MQRAKEAGRDRVIAAWQPQEQPQTTAVHDQIDELRWDGRRLT